ncbi:N-acetylglucosamine-specific PTS transporter subunit IIBC [Pseudorhodoferax sp. Leaf267]|uniref:N-acetylglucosamine-specific PTS transporter subunit IIBC n=1 Tax=Pseudorhodoferax sp. Leaf267 TaxID=1736316 RepID=UPI0006F508A1|nr:N-acetylglucosamine-specific PTS transporter subunit IIBC [Pseudorhodoferax sp. Leaf267]KQP13234.1 PTS N-acetyl-D-glucosamine transporter [Pseudorhodoferax sp. Leaf267]
MSLNHFAALQQLGRTLMLPIAVLPIAGLLLRLGQPDLLDIPFMAQAGDAVFSNLALLFAVGVAVGFAKDSHGVAGLAGAVGYFVLTAAMKTIDPAINMGVLSGLIMGVVAGLLYNRYRAIALPEWLAFFGGKRFVPIATGLAGLALALLFGHAWPPIQHGIDAVGHWLIGSGSIGVFLYGLLNRLLLITGLHHILNNLVWFVFGDYTTAANLVVHGDLKRFFAGDPAAGAFMAGFFPVMMFGLPAACLAIYRTARPENRSLVGGVLLSMGLTSFFTGVTEPIEFAFMFLAPVLFGLHAVLTGLSMALLHALGVKAGFTFSGGALDYVLSFGISTRSWLIVPVGLAYSALYYGLFTYFIRRFDLKTMGREDAAPAGKAAARTPAQARAQDWLAALGGADNLLGVAACTSRLRLSLRDTGCVDGPRLKALGAKGIVRPPEVGMLQVVLGAEAQDVADGLRAALLPSSSEPMPLDGHTPRAQGFIAALGGARNLKRVDACTTRLRLEVVDNALVREAALRALGARGVICPAPGSVQVVLGPIADQVASEIREAMHVAA